ncbi:MAG: hypothetical protein GY839_02190 [candidate division Zixibacteria bacterium]|nr:hypothetical protein [candidate division Zixibacteria bacterium]
MRKKVITISLSILLVFCVAEISLSRNSINSFQYISPVDNAKYVSKETNIIIRPGELLDIAGIDLMAQVEVIGSIGGNYYCDVVIGGDGKTLIIKARDSFNPGELITVALNHGLISYTGQQMESAEFSFTVSPKVLKITNDTICPVSNGTGYETPDDFIVLNDDPSLPTDFPEFTITANDQPDSGYIFLSNLYLMILDNSAYPVFYKKMPSLSYDFKVQPNGLLTYFSTETDFFYAMDSTYSVVDSFRCGNGYGENTDFHDFQILDNGHMLMLARDPQLIDMSEIIEGGNPNAIVIGQIIQELDTLKNVIFQWRSWDHIEITDAAWNIDLRGPTVDYIHVNSLELDNDGNLLISSRNLQEITKIDRESGEIIWRFGGENNEYTLIGDLRWFSLQHDARRILNGNVTLFDNGNLNYPPYSRGLEYQLDEINKTATLIREDRNTPDVFSFIMGSYQRLPGGNSIVGWGGGTPCFTEIRPNGEKAFEVNSGGSYRSFRFPWHGVALKPYLLAELEDSIAHLTFNKFGDTTVVGYYIYMGETSNPMTIIDSTYNNYYYLLIPPGNHYIRVTSYDDQHIEGLFSNEVALGVAGDYEYYLPGDANMANGAWPPGVIGGDVTFLVNYFRSLPSSQACLLDGFWCSADINGDCLVIGSDVTKLVNYFRGMTELGYCVDYEPAWPTPDDLPAEAPEGWPNCDNNIAH